MKLAQSLKANSFYFSVGAIFILGTNFKTMYLFFGKDKDFYKVEESEKENCKRFEANFKCRKKIIKK